MNLEENWIPREDVVNYMILDLKQDCKTFKQSMDTVNLFIGGFGDYSANQIFGEVMDGSEVGKVFYDFYESLFEDRDKAIQVLSR